MKKVAPMIVAVMLLVCAGMAFAFQNEPKGFRGIKWGDPLREDMELLVEHNGFLIYFCPDEVVIGKSFTSYSFWEGCFTGVIITFKGEDTYEFLKKFCRDAYGEWYDVEKELNEGFLNYKLRWTGQKSFIDLLYDTQHEQGSWLIRSTVIAQEKLVAEKKKEAEKAVGDW